MSAVTCQLAARRRTRRAGTVSVTLLTTDDISDMLRMPDVNGVDTCVDTFVKKNADMHVNTIDTDVNTLLLTPLTPMTKPMTSMRCGSALSTRLHSC